MNDKTLGGYLIPGHWTGDTETKGTKRPIPEHRCDSPSGDGFCEEQGGVWITGNGGYVFQVNFCPFCGAKAPKQVEEAQAMTEGEQDIAAAVQGDALLQAVIKATLINPDVHPQPPEEADDE